ncbi:DUF4129 domain-containing protein [Luteimonas sp. BDR2-5]|uniref:DUF4129 domain-containing protein n=1 Tax=Proluteimonas luteida TaxID=2878685 RepID=UPI001E4CF09E|nr:DUF4129 domain-containing protein [Luteimonas sp. BDR2-5]MCD9029513.1 DUF4129 domain-containing protein [Luteimonas sp. BDR2-5]
MRVDTVQVELRPRSPWEAMELGNALVRRHAAAIWVPWLLLGLPVFVAVAALGWSLDRLGLAALLLLWIKPVLDRIPLFVLSRAVFGEAPGWRRTLAAQLRWGWRPLLGHLTWRRLSPWRAVTLPVDLLEGIHGPQLKMRRRVLVEGIGGHVLLLTAICLLFTAVLLLSLLLLVFLFVPNELLSESARAAWTLATQNPPRWAQLLLVLALWIAVGVVEPFFVAAGFGLYLNRRTQLEAWDLEIAFRRLRARIVPAGAALAALLACGLLLSAPVPAPAQERADVAPTKTWSHDRQARDSGADAGIATATLPRVFEDAVVDSGAFVDAVDTAYADPLLSPKRTEVGWQKRDPATPRPRDTLPDFGGLQWLIVLLSTIAEYGLWLVLGVLVAALALTARRWWPWMRAGLRGPVREDREIGVSEAAVPEPLPADLPTAVRRLWREGRQRDALALLYRGSVEAMAARAGATLVPGATEAECLRISRRMPEAADRAAFASVVRVWQRAAYARRLPGDAEFDALLDVLGPRFGSTGSGPAGAGGAG